MCVITPGNTMLFRKHIVPNASIVEAGSRSFTLMGEKFPFVSPVGVVGNRTGLKVYDSGIFLSRSSSFSILVVSCIKRPCVCCRNSRIINSSSSIFLTKSAFIPPRWLTFILNCSAEIRNHVETRLIHYAIQNVQVFMACTIRKNQ